MWLGRKLGRKVHVTLELLQLRLMMLPRCIFMEDGPLPTQPSMINGLTRTWYVYWWYEDYIEACRHGRANSERELA